MIQSNFSISRDNFIPNTEIEVNGYKFIVSEILPTEAGKGKQYKGVLVFPDGTKKSFLEKPVFVTKLNEYAGVKGTKVVTGKKEASHNTGASKVISVSNLSEAAIEEAIHAEHKKAVKAYNKLLAVLDIDTTFATDIEMYHVFMKALNKTHTDTRNRLEAKLSEQRRMLDVAKQAEVKRMKKARLARLVEYVKNYDALIGQAAMKGNDIRVKKLCLTKDERLSRANILIAELFKEIG